MAKDAYGTNVNRANAGGVTPPPPGYLKGDTGKPGGTPTGSAPMLGNRLQGEHVGPIGGSGKTISSPKPFSGGMAAGC